MKKVKEVIIQCIRKTWNDIQLVRIKILAQRITIISYWEAIVLYRRVIRYRIQKDDVGIITIRRNKLTGLETSGNHLLDEFIKMLFGKIFAPEG